MAISYYSIVGHPKATRECLDGKIVFTDNGMIFPGLKLIGRVARVANSRLTAISLPRDYSSDEKVRLAIDWDDAPEGSRARERGGEEKVCAITSVLATCDTVDEANVLLRRSTEAERRFNEYKRSLAHFICEGDDVHEDVPQKCGP